MGGEAGRPLDAATQSRDVTYSTKALVYRRQHVVVPVAVSWTRDVDGQKSPVEMKPGYECRSVGRTDGTAPSETDATQLGSTSSSRRWTN